MSLLGRIKNTLRNDVVKPVQRVVNQPQRVNAQQLLQALQADQQRRFAQQGRPQVHPAVHAQVHASLLHDVTHNPVTNAVGSIVKGAAQPVGELGKAIYYTPHAVAREIQNKPITDIQKKAFGTTDQGKIAKKIVGDTVQVGGLIAAPGSSAAKTTLTKKIATGAAKGAAINTVAGGGAQLAQNGKLNAKGLAENAALGAVLGGTAPVVSKGIKLAKDNKVPLNEKGAVNPSPAPVEKTPLTSVKTQKQGTVKTEQGSDPQAYLQQQIQAQEIARKAGQPVGFGKASAAKSEAKRKLVDSFAPIEDTLNKSIKQGAKVAPAEHLTYQIDRALRGDTIGAQYIKDKGLAKVIQNVPDTKAFDQYLIAKHAADLEGNGIKTGRNLTADKQLVEHLAPQYEAHAQALKQYSNNLLDDAVNYGLVNKDVAAGLKQKYPNYVPVNRIFGEGELTGPPKGVGGGKVSVGTQSIVQKIKGSNRQIESPLSSLIDKSVDLVKQGERNKAAQILTSYKDLPGNPFKLRELGPEETVGVKPVISTLENGGVRRFETTPEIASAAKSLTKEQLGLVGQILAAPTRVLRLGATSLNPAFALANVTKDSVSAFINSSHPLRSSVANPAVFIDALKAAVNHSSEQYGELVRQGAGGTSYDIARNAPKQNVRSIRLQKNAGTKTLYTVTTPTQLFRAAENAIGRSEEFNRALQYFGNKQAALKGGSSAEEAQILGAHAARNNTVNFARAGDYGRVVNSVLPYLNAGIQGSRTFLRNLKDRPAQTTAKLALTAFFPTAVITAWNTGDPERKAAYDDIKDYEKQGNLIIVPPHPVKDKNGKWNVIKIPVSQEIANLNDIVRNGVETAVGDGTLHIGQLIGNAVGTVTSLNAQNPRQLLGQVTPQAIKPGIESLTNQNLYTGNQIVPDSQKNLPARDQVGTGTSGTATELGKATGLSPRQIDNAIRTTTGGLGQNVVNATDTALAKTGLIKQDQVKGKSVPASVTGRFTGAQGQTPYDIADKKFSDLSKELQKDPSYKNLSSQDKAKALNRLQTQVTSTYVPQKNSDGSQKSLTTRQQDILGGKPDLKSYLTAQTSTKATSSKEKYQKAVDAYNKNQGSYTDAKRIQAQDSLKKLKVSSNYDQGVVDLYGLSKTKIYQYITTNNNGNDIAKQLKAYDQALKDSGVNTTLKFKNGFGPKIGTSTGSSRSGGTKASVAKLKLGRLPKTRKANLAGLKTSKKSKRTSIAFKKLGSSRQKKIRIA